MYCILNFFNRSKAFPQKYSTTNTVSIVISDAGSMMSSFSDMIVMRRLLVIFVAIT